MRRKGSKVKADPADRKLLTRDAAVHLFKRGMVLGLFNLLAFASLLKALSMADASIVIPIYSMYVIIPVLLTTLINGEVLTPKTTVAVVLSVAAIVIMQ